MAAYRCRLDCHILPRLERSRHENQNNSREFHDWYSCATPQYPSASFLGVPPEVRIHHVYPYILRNAQVHAQYLPGKTEHNGTRTHPRVTWKPCQPSATFLGLCANPYWGNPCNGTQGVDVLALMRTCKKIAVEMRAIIFEEAVICIDMQDIFHLQGFNVFGRVTQISIHGHNSLTKKLYEAVGFAPNSENLFSSTIFRTTFPRVRKASFYICHDPSFGISNEAIVNIVRAAAWVPEINVAKVHLTNPGGTETSTFTKSAAAAQCYGAPVL